MQQAVAVSWLPAVPACHAAGKRTDECVPAGPRTPLRTPSAPPASRPACIARRWPAAHQHSPSPGGRLCGCVEGERGEESVSVVRRQLADVHHRRAAVCSAGEGGQPLSVCRAAGIAGGGGGTQRHASRATAAHLAWHRRRPRRPQMGCSAPRGSRLLQGRQNGELAAEAKVGSAARLVAGGDVLCRQAAVLGAACHTHTPAPPPSRLAGRPPTPPSAARSGSRASCRQQPGCCGRRPAAPASAALAAPAAAAAEAAPAASAAPPLLALPPGGARGAQLPCQPGGGLGARRRVRRERSSGARRAAQLSLRLARGAARLPAAPWPAWRPCGGAGALSGAG